jgi:hypothetical protein
MSAKLVVNSKEGVGADFPRANDLADAKLREE